MYYTQGAGQVNRFQQSALPRHLPPIAFTNENLPFWSGWWRAGCGSRVGGLSLADRASVVGVHGELVLPELTAALHALVDTHYVTGNVSSGLLGALRLGCAAGALRLRLCGHLWRAPAREQESRLRHGGLTSLERVTNIRFFRTVCERTFLQDGVLAGGLGLAAMLPEGDGAREGRGLFM